MSNAGEKGGCRIADIEVQSPSDWSELKPSTVHYSQIKRGMSWLETAAGFIQKKTISEPEWGHRIVIASKTVEAPDKMAAFWWLC